jgi:hypothetical protein
MCGERFRICDCGLRIWKDGVFVISSPPEADDKAIYLSSFMSHLIDSSRFFSVTPNRSQILQVA